jgi:hypothetical protein
VPSREEALHGSGISTKVQGLFGKLHE